MVSDRKPHRNDPIGPISKIHPVPEAPKKLAGGATTGQRPRNTNRALEGREKGTRGVAGNIAGGIRTLLAPLPGRMPNREWWDGPVPVVSPPANLF